MSWYYPTSRKAIVQCHASAGEVSAGEAGELHQLGRICQLAELDELGEFGELGGSRSSTLGASRSSTLRAHTIAGVDDISRCATLGDRLYRHTGHSSITITSLPPGAPPRPRPCTRCAAPGPPGSPPPASSSSPSGPPSCSSYTSTKRSHAQVCLARCRKRFFSVGCVYSLFSVVYSFFSIVCVFTKVI